MPSVYKWMLRKVRDINYKRLDEFVTIMARENHKSKFYIKTDIFKNILTRGIGYTDYFRGDYLNLTKKEKDTFVTTKTFYRLLAYLNNPNYTVLLNDKIIFNSLFKDYLKRDFINLREASLDEFKEFVKSKKVVFAKDPTGYGGYGVKKIILSEYPDLKELYEDLKKKKLLLIEEEIVQEKELNEINPNVVNSFRVITLYKDGEAHIIGNALRINQDASNVIGSTNDLYFSLGTDGKIDSNVIDDYGNVYKKHPLTGKQFDEVFIPEVKEAFEMCKELALKIPQVRYIGWDIAFSEKGPVIVEGNEYPGYGIIQFYKLKNKKTGHLKDISDVLQEEMKNIKL